MPSPGKFAIVDYHKGNIKSVERGLAAAGADVQVTDEPTAVASARAIVLPGVGAFADAMRTLEELELACILRERISEGVPFLGICLGQHLMFDAGEEHAEPGAPTPGLGLIPGTVVHMPKCDAAGDSYKIPHVGWNSVNPDIDPKGCCQDSLFRGIDPGEFFYFTHSYISPASEFTIAETTHSVTFPSAVKRGNAYGVQFHPEKSSAAGAKLLENFVHLAQNG